MWGQESIATSASEAGSRASGSPFSVPSQITLRHTQPDTYTAARRRVFQESPDAVSVTVDAARVMSGDIQHSRLHTPYLPGFRWGVSELGSVEPVCAERAELWDATVTGTLIHTDTGTDTDTHARTCTCPCPPPPPAPSSSSASTWACSRSSSLHPPPRLARLHGSPTPQAPVAAV